MKQPKAARIAHDGRSGYPPVAEYEMLSRFARGATGVRRARRGVVARVACLLILVMVIAGVVLSVVRVA